MNPFNLLINYIIANSRASFYNVPGNQEITNTALLTGIVSENPLMSYLIIDNKAKIEGEKVIVPTAAGTASSTAPGLPAASGVTVNLPTDTSAPAKGTETGVNQSFEIITLEAVKTEITASNKMLREDIATTLESNKAEIGKMIAEKFDSKIVFLEKSNAVLNDSILEIKKRLDEISKGSQARDTAAASKNIVAQKASAKTDTK